MQAVRNHFRVLGLDFCSVQMGIEDSLVVSVFLSLAVERSNAFFALLYAVAVSLVQRGKDECVWKEICEDYVAGGAAGEPRGGTAILVRLRRTWEFDPTRGYPGQDILSRFLLH